MAKGMQQATNMRRVLEKVMTKQINKMRPEIRTGRVWSYSLGNQTAQILFPGNTNLVPAHFALDKIPTNSILDNLDPSISSDSVGYWEAVKNAEADAVRIAGKPNDWFILDFVFGSPGTAISVFDENFNSDITGYQDYATAIGPGVDVQIDLTYQPLPNEGIIVFWWGKALEDDEWEWGDDRWTIIVHDPESRLHVNDRFMVKYFYRDPTTKPAVVYGPPIWHARSHEWGPHQSGAAITSLALPVGTQLGDALVINLVGDLSNVVTDARFETVNSTSMHRILIGYADTLDPISCNVSGQSFPLDQFAGIGCLAMRGDPSAQVQFVDLAQIATSFIAPGAAVPGSAYGGSGAIMAIAAGFGNTITIDWASMPAYEDWGGDDYTSVLGHFGYCPTNPSPAQTNPTNANALVASIGLK